jgi:predicted nucleic acid-binding protein
VKRIVADTGPLLHLSEAQALNLLWLAGECHIPARVAAEMVGRNPEWHNPAWIRLDDLIGVHASEALRWQQAGLLDAGEAEAVALARQIEADWLLTDDAAARLFATELGLEAHGSLGVVLWAAALGYLDREEAAAVLARLAGSSLWISARVLDEARSALDEMFG